MKKIFFFKFVLNKYQSVTHVSTCNFCRPDFFPPCTLPYKLKENIFVTKIPLNYFSLKVTKFHGDSVKNESARTKKLQGFRVTEYSIESNTPLNNWRFT